MCFYRLSLCFECKKKLLQEAVEIELLVNLSTFCSHLSFWSAVLCSTVIYLNCFDGMYINFTLFW